MKDEGAKAVDAASSFSFYPGLPPPVKVSLTVLGEHPCPYLPGRTSRSRALWAERMPAELYHRFMNAGFRRSGKLVYQPVCGGCRACLPIRVPVETFQPSKSQRRCRRRNHDLVVALADPVATDENYELYRRYVAGRHGRCGEDEDRESFERFLYDSPVDTIEFS